MMSVAPVSPILKDMDNLVGFLRRGRLDSEEKSRCSGVKRGRMDSDYSDFDLIAERPKRRKIETNLGIPKQQRLAEEEKYRCSEVRSGYYLNKCLGLNDDEIVSLQNENTNNLLLNHKKLHLVLDLDHTILNSTFLDELSPDEEYLKTQTQCDHSQQHLYTVDTPDMHMITKLRPYIRTFLAQASQMFELSIYTMGCRDYALEMAKLLDPGNQIFGGRVISRDDSTNADRKALDVLFVRESAVVILDDTKDVWTDDNQENVIVMPRYHFFKSSCHQYEISGVKPYSELKTDEYDQYGRPHLAKVLQLLRHVHSRFFDEVEMKGWDLVDRDVRLVLKNLQKEVLKGCKIVFSHIFPLHVKADTHRFWKLAEQLGATCSTEVDPSVTHVVSAEARTHKSLWAVKQGKFLVNPKWIHTALFMWQKPPEVSFPVDTNINQLLT